MTISYHKSRDLVAQVAKDIMSKWKFKTLKDTEEILLYFEGRYIPENKMLKQYAQVFLDENATISTVNEVIAYVARSTMTERSQFDCNPALLNAKNCRINLETGASQQFDPYPLTTMQIPVDYDPNATCPKIMQFLKEIAPDDVDVLLDWVAYTLWRGNPLKKALMLLGDGDNGKGTFIKLLEAFLGEENVSAASLQKLQDDRFAVADLYGKLLNACGDIPSKTLSDTSIFRQLTGNDELRGEQKFKQPFKFTFMGKLVFSANKLPPADEDLDAYYRRWTLVDFPNKFEKSNDDTNKLAQITSEEELSGLLTAALERLPRVLKEGIKVNETVEQIKEKYLANTESEDRFIAEAIEEDGAQFTSKDDMYIYYKAYCRRHRLMQSSREAFGKRMKKHKYVAVNHNRTGQYYKDDQIMKNGKRTYFWLLLKVKPEWEQAHREWIDKVRSEEPSFPTTDSGGNS